MTVLAVLIVSLFLATDLAWSGGFRGRAGTFRGTGMFVHRGAAPIKGSKVGAFRPPGQRIFVPHSSGVIFHSQHGPFARFVLPSRRFFFGTFPPFIYSPIFHRPLWSGYWPYAPGPLIIEVPAQPAPLADPAEPDVLGRDFAPAPFLPGSRTRTRPDQLAPFDPTPQEVVAHMLRLAQVKEGDVLYDLGSGDGRMLIAAAKQYGIKGVGFEVDPGLVKLAREKIREEGVEQLVEIRQQDFLTADLSPASVVTLYLSQDANQALKPMLMKQLAPGARVVSYTFDMGDWQPKLTQSYRDAAGDAHALYLWEIAQPSTYSEKNQKPE